MHYTAAGRESNPKEERIPAAAGINKMKNILIHSYTRRQAIEDGVLVDVSQTAKEAGLKCPVAVTQEVWGEIITPDESSRKRGQSEEGRLWDVIWMCAMAIRNKLLRIGRAGSLVVYQIYLEKDLKLEVITLKALCHPGDTGESVITIMLPDED